MSGNGPDINGNLAYEKIMASGIGRKDLSFQLSGIGTKGESIRKDKFGQIYYIVYQDKFQMNAR